MEVKLICLDMDGTLFAKNHEIPQINISALRRAIQRGIRVALVSGRNYRFLGEFALKIDPGVILVSSNGSRIDEYTHGRCLYECTFAPEEYLKAAQAYWDLGLYFEVYTENKNYIFRQELIPEDHRRALDNYLLNGHVIATETVDGAPIVPLGGVYKLVAFSPCVDKIISARAYLDELGIRHCSSGSNNIEVMPRNSGKGAAVRRLAELFGIPVSEIMAFGDYTNDLEMLQAAGHGVAMENGVDELKAVAELIAPRNTEGGVGQIIYKYVLEEAFE